MNNFKTKKIAVCLLFGCLLLLSGSLAYGRILDNFENLSDWGIYGSGHDPAQCKLEVVDHEGKRALKITNVLPPASSDSRYAGPSFNRRNLVGPTLSFYLYGNNNGKQIIIRCTDQTEETFQWKSEVINWTGWKKVTVDLSESNIWVNWEGNNNRKIDGGLRLRGIHIEYGTGNNEINETLYLAELEVEDFPEEISVTFTDSAYDTTTGLYRLPNVHEGETLFVGNVGGKSAQLIDTANQTYYLHIDVDDAFVASIPENHGVEVGVEYYDDNFSMWGPYLQYNALAGGNFTNTPKYDKTNTGSWKLAKFVITDPDFRNGQSGADFRVVADSRFGSGQPLAVHKITLKTVPLGNLSGRVTSGGDGIGGVTVTALHPDYPGMPLTTTTDDSGNYSLKVPLGTCVVYAAKDGYQRAKAENVVIAGAVNLDLSLEAGYSDGVSITFGRYNDANGLYLRTDIAEGAVFVTEVQGAGDPEPRVVRRTHRDTKNYFFFLNVSDAYMYRELHPVDITVTYLDQGTGTWRVDYNSATTGYQFGPEVRKTDSGEWKTVTFRLLDAFFANQTSGADIRLNAKWDGGEDDEWLSYVKVKKVPTAQVSGIVKNGDPQIPITLADAEIKLTSTTYENVIYTTTSNSVGEFTFEDVPVDEYRVIVSKDGFGYYQTTIEVTEAGAYVEAALVEGMLGFEEADYGIVWTLTSATANFSLDSQEKYAGEVSLKATGAEASQYKGTILLPVTGADSYKLEVWIKTQDISTSDGVYLNALQVSAEDAALGFYLNSPLVSTGGSHGWQRFTATLERSRMHKDTAYLRLYVRLAEGAGGTAWFDNLTLKPVLTVEDLEADVSSFSPALDQKITFSYAVPIGSLLTLEVYNDDHHYTLFESVPLRGSASFQWDGKADGMPAPDGTYTYRLTAVCGGELVFAEGQVVIDNTGPGKPEIFSPETGELLEHNQPFILLQGQVDEESRVVAFREVEGDVVAAAVGITDPLGAFSLTVDLLEGDNKLWVVAYDELGNPSEASEEVLINYDAQRSIGIITVLNGDLLSPADGNGIRDELSISFYLLNPGTISFTVEGPSGVVWQEELEIAEEQDILLTWRGIDQAYQQVADGTYRYTVKYQSDSAEETFVDGTLIIDNTPPKEPIMLYPKAGSTVTGQPNLAWEKLADAVFYRLYLGESEDLDEETPIQITASEYQLKDLSQGRWYWRLVAVDWAGNESEAARGYFTIADLDQSQFDVVGFQVGPNPFTPNKDGRREKLVVAYTLRQPGKVRVSIINLAGQPVYEQEFGQLPAGDHQFSWDGTDKNGNPVGTGAYILRLVAKNPTSWGPAVKVQPVFVLR